MAGRFRQRLATAVVALCVPLVATAGALPVAETQLLPPPLSCADDEARYAATGRVFPEIWLSGGYLTFEEFETCITFLADLHPDRVTVDTYGQSIEGRGLYVVEVTDQGSAVPYEERVQLLVDVSIHGNERIGVEGGVRFTEDLATATDPATLRLLRNQVLVFIFPNPDGWARGDHVRAGTRQNAAGVDLNRTFPSIGYVRSAWRPLEQPESQATHDLYRDERYARAAWGISPHGYTAATRSWQQILLMAGEYDLGRSLSNQYAAQLVVDRMREATTDHPLTLTELGPGIETAGMYGTVWETRRALNTGFLGNWLAMPAPVGLDTLGFAFEHWQTEGTPFTHPITSYHIAANRAGLRATMEAAAAGQQVHLDLQGVVGYLHDPAIITEATAGAYEPADDYQASFGQRPYTATRMRFFEDLAPYAGAQLVSVDADEVDGTLTELDVFVVTEDLLDVNPQTLAAYAASGGTVVLTDGALAALPEIVDLGSGTVQRKTGLVARMDDGVGAGRDTLPTLTADPDADTRDFSHPLLAGLNREDHYAEQLYEPVPMGFSLDDQAAPWWTVDAAAFTAAGGQVAGLDPGGDVIVGDLEVGSGRVVVIGGLLPQPTNAHFHPWGLGNYSVTYTGWQIFLNAIGAEATLLD